MKKGPGARKELCSRRRWGGVRAPAGWAATIVLATLAGCTGGPSSDVAEVPSATRVVPASEVLANSTGSEASGVASWSVGDWWRYQFRSTVTGIPEFQITLVVAGDDGSAYDLTAVEPDHVEATFFTHMPSLGPVRKDDLAVTRHGHYVPFLQFPLHAGATWQVDVRGTWTAEVTRAEIPFGGERLPGWRIDYWDNESLQHVVEWSPAVNGTVREMAMFGDDRPHHSLELVAWGHNWTGTVSTYRATDLYRKGHDVEGPATYPDAFGVDTFTVPAGGDRLLVGAFTGGAKGTCAVGWARPLAHVPPELPTYHVRDCLATALDWSSFDPEPGEWHFGWALAADPSFVFGEAFRIDAEDVTVGAS